MKQSNFKSVRKIKLCFHSVLIAVVMVCMFSCNNDSDEQYYIRMGVTESDVDWIEVWPGEGNEDGRFYVKVYSNSTSEERTSSLNIIYGGEVYWTIPVIQH